MVCLKIMSKMGISVVSSYRGGCNFEAIGLSRNLMSEYFPSMSSKLSGMGLVWSSKIFILHIKKLMKKMLLIYLLGVFIDTEKEEKNILLKANSIHILQSAVGTRQLLSYIKNIQNLLNNSTY